MKKIVVIGANEFQLPLIQEINRSGYESHVIAWEDGSVGKDIAHAFYPISITEKEKILKVCEEIQPSAVLSAGSDLAVIAVNYVCNRLGLVGNSQQSTIVSTNKYDMRRKFDEYNISSPKFLKVTGHMDKPISEYGLQYPVIVKPTDRSGSRGIAKVKNEGELRLAIDSAIQESFANEALVEEYVEGEEYSVEMISCKGVHRFLNITQKFTTGSPHFIETMHIQPPLNNGINLDKVIKIVSNALDALDIKFGASHTEVKINCNGDIKIIEIGGRMGGDYIGSHLVKLSTGVDYVKQIINIGLGNVLEDIQVENKGYAIVKFIFNKNDVENMKTIFEKFKNLVVQYQYKEIKESEVLSSADRGGYYILKINNRETVERVLNVINHEE